MSVLLQIQDVWECGLKRLGYLSGCSKATKILHREQFQMTKNPRKDVHFNVSYYFCLWQSASTYDPTPREAQTVKYKTINELTDLPMWAIYVIIGVSALIMIALVATIIAVSLIHALLASRRFSNFLINFTLYRLQLFLISSNWNKTTFILYSNDINLRGLSRLM